MNATNDTATQHDATRRAFLKRLARYGYAVPVILTVLSQEAQAGLSGYNPPHDGEPDDPPRRRKRRHWWDWWRPCRPKWGRNPWRHHR